MNLRVSFFAVASLAVAFLLPVASQAQAAMPDKQAGTFDLVIGDQKIGKSVYKLEKVKGGYKLTNRSTYRVSGADGDQSDEFKLSDALGFMEGTTVDHNAQLQTSYVPSKARDEVTITRFQQAGHDSNIVPSTPALIVLPPLDAGAAQVALLLAITHPTADNKYSLLIPNAGGGGRGGGGGGRRGGGGAASSSADASASDTLPAGDNAPEFTFLKGKPTSGIVDGKPVLLNSYLFGVGGVRVILYADADNNLMQLNAAAFHASYIRQGFKLNMGAAGAPAAPPKP